MVVGHRPTRKNSQARGSGGGADDLRGRLADIQVQIEQDAQARHAQVRAAFIQIESELSGIHDKMNEARLHLHHMAKKSRSFERVEVAVVLGLILQLAVAIWISWEVWRG